MGLVKKYNVCELWCFNMNINTVGFIAESWWGPHGCSRYSLIIINDVLFMWDIFNVICNMITHLERSWMGYLLFLEINA